MPLPLRDVLVGLEVLAPLELAADWDNVGLLLEPPPRDGEQHQVSRMLLTIELSDAVLDEAIARHVELVLAYHPIIFKGLKRVTTASPEGRLLLRAIDHRLALYSPHTALDAVVGGVNDWLADGVGSGRRRPIEPNLSAPAGTGMGRIIELAEPLDVSTMVARIKDHLGLDHLRIAPAARHEAGAAIEIVAVCAGAGGSLLSDLRGVDLVLTGEMRHHDVRELAARGTSVVLCDHTNTERGYLPFLAKQLDERWGSSLEVLVARQDRDPLRVV